MLHLIDKKNRSQPRYSSLLEETYRLRHDVYVRERGWKALERPDGREVDQFDTPDAIYFVWANDTHVLGGARFIPTDKPHLMSEIFPQIATFAPVPRREDIWEITRLFSIRDPSGRVNRNTVIGDLLCGMFEMGLHHGLSAISVVSWNKISGRSRSACPRPIPRGFVSRAYCRSTMSNLPPQGLRAE
jgi:acyl-homoserine lactone synthase